MSPMTDLTNFNLTRDELLDIKRILTLLNADWHNPGAARHITNGSFDCDREVADAIYRIDHVLECNPVVDGSETRRHPEESEWR